MADEEKKSNIKSDIDEKLFTVKYKPDDGVCHLKPDEKQCVLCDSKVCTYICPAHVYEWDDEKKKLVIGYENCLECGACRIACERKCIEWSYPKGSKGVTFKHG